MIRDSIELEIGVWEVESTRQVRCWKEIQTRNFPRQSFDIGTLDVEGILFVRAHSADVFKHSGLPINY